MRRRFLSLILMLAMFMTISAEAAGAAVPETTSRLQDCVDSGMSVIVVGDYEFTSLFSTEEADTYAVQEANEAQSMIDCSDMITYVESLADLPATRATNSNDMVAVIISQEVANNYISQGNEQDALEVLLDSGGIAYFPETSYTNMSSIFEAITGDNFNMIPVEENNTDQVAAYVFKDLAGNYYTGNIIASSDTSQEVVDERILVETLENHDIYAVGRSTSDFEPGYEWNQLSTWHKNSFEGESSSRVWFSEWICFYSTRTPDGDHYYAWAGEWCMEPYKISGVQWLSDYVKYESECSGLQSGIQLRDYWPISTPSSETGSISLGINSDGDYDFGISYDWQIDELEFTDNSRPSQEYCKLQWDFNHPLFGNGYDEEVAYAKFAMIFKDTLKADSYTFHHYRTAYLYAQNILGESAGANYRSTYDFEP